MNHIEWEEIKVASGRGISHKRTVSLRSHTKGGKPNHLFISSDLVAKLGWKESDRVNLYHKGSTFMLKPHKVGLYTLRKTAPNSLNLYIGGAEVCSIVHAFGNSDEYDAWIDDGCVLFRPKEGEKVG